MDQPRRVCQCWRVELGFYFLRMVPATIRESQGGPVAVVHRLASAARGARGQVSAGAKMNQGEAMESAGKVALWAGSAAGAALKCLEQALRFADSHAAGLSVLIAFAGLCVTCYYKRRADQRAVKAEREGRLVEVTGVDCD